MGEIIFQILQGHQSQLEDVRVSPPKLVVLVGPKEPNRQECLSVVSSLRNHLHDLTEPCPVWTILHEENLVLFCSGYDVSDGITHVRTIHQDQEPVKQGLSYLVTA